MPAMPAPSLRRRAGAAAAVGIAAALLGIPGSASPAGGAQPAVRLTITFIRDEGAPRHVTHLRCQGDRARADGYLADVGAQRACRLARRHARLLASIPDGRRACTQIYGGPERARVRGRIGARRVDRPFTRSDGCRIDEWTRAMPLLPRPRPLAP
jgi:hypothetical protein